MEKGSRQKLGFRKTVFYVELGKRIEPPAGGIEPGGPQGCRPEAPRGAEATLGAPVPRWGLGLHPRTTGESPKTRPKNTNIKNPFGFN